MLKQSSSRTSLTVLLMSSRAGTAGDVSDGFNARNMRLSVASSVPVRLRSPLLPASAGRRGGHSFRGQPLAKPLLQKCWGDLDMYKKLFVVAAACVVWVTAVSAQGPVTVQ